MTHALERNGIARVMRVAGLALAAAAILSACSVFGGKSEREPAELREISQVMGVRQVWELNVGADGAYLMQPVVAGAYVYASAANGTVTAIESATGRIVWQARAGVGLTSGAGSDGALTVVAGEKGVIVAFDDQGAQKWKTSVNGEVLTPPLVGHGLAVVRTTDGRLFGLDASSGDRKWLYQRSSSTLSLRGGLPMTLAGDQILLGFTGGKLGAVTAGDGVLRWEAAVSQPRGVSEIERLNDVTGAPSIDGQQVCAASFQGRVACFDRLTGAPRWGRELSSLTGAVQAGGRVFASSDRSILHGFDARSGADLWRNDALLWRGLSAPLAFGRAVVVGDAQGWLHFLSGEDGQFIARVKTDGSAISAAPVMAGRMLIVQTRRGGVYGYAPE